MAAVTHLDVPDRRSRAGRAPLAIVAPAATPCGPGMAPGASAVYRRRRLVLLALVTVVVVAMAGPLRSWIVPRSGSGASEASDGVRPPAARTVSLVDGGTYGTYVVQPGDTLWAIAARLEPGSDPRPVVDHLAQLNGGADVSAGQRLVLPP